MYLQLFGSHEDQPLPRIKRARAATEPAVCSITAIAREAAAGRTRHLVLLTGVPGAGKTLVGLQSERSRNERLPVRRTPGGAGVRTGRRWPAIWACRELVTAYEQPPLSRFGTFATALLAASP